MSTFTDTIGLIKQITGRNPNVWGDILNASFMDVLDQGISGRAEPDVTAGDVTLTTDPGVAAADDARSMIITVVGTPGAARDVLVPSLEKLYVVDNQSNGTVTVKTSLGTGVAITAGSLKILRVSRVLDDVLDVAIGVGNSFEEMGDSNPTSYSWDDFSSGSSGANIFTWTTTEGNTQALVVNNLPSTTIAATTMRFRPTAGGNHPFVLPTRVIDVPCQIIEGGATARDCFCRLDPAQPDLLEWFKADGSGFTNPSLRGVRPVVFSYPINTT